MIKNIIFDFGGVILNLDYGLTDEAFKKLFELNFNGRLYPKDYIFIFNNYEKGSFSETSFFYQLQKTSGIPAPPAVIRDAWNKMLLDIPLERLEWLRQLRSSHKIVLLSNTNHTHLTHIFQRLRSDMHIDDFDGTYFDATFYSHLIGMRKPDSDIFEHVLHTCRFTPEHTLFIDDTADNLVVPEQMGLKTCHHPRNGNLRMSVENFL